jgi:hypothetical protein
MLGDERDEVLNGYDSLIQIYDLDPPEGFSDMESFNAELNAWLDRAHPTTREYLDQSLRNGSQTPDKLFGVGHDLVERLQLRIREAITRYIAGMKADERPCPVVAAGQFDYTGSWSSRLRDCGFHTNHIHPEGWISSCYCVALRGRSRTVKPAKAGSNSANRRWMSPSRIPSAALSSPGRGGWCFSHPICGTAPFRSTTQSRGPR